MFDLFGYQVNDIRYFKQTVKIKVIKEEEVNI